MLCFEWLDFSGDTVSGYRSESTGKDKVLERGAQLNISKADFGIEDLFISADLLPNNPTDKLQRLNFAVQANQQLQVPLGELLESLDLGNSQVLRDAWQMEQIENGVLQTVIEKMKINAEMEAQMQMQAAQAGLEQGQQQPPNIPQPPQQPQGPASQQLAEGQGFNAAEGGTPNQTAAPTDTREGLTQRTQGGGAIG